MGYTKAQQDGKGTSKGKSPEVMDAERRAKKARQNADARARKGTNVGVGTTIFDAIREDRQKKVAERREAREAQQREVEMFQLQQAIEALNSTLVTSLKEGTTARVVAEAMIRNFPDARGNRDRKISKTRVAFEKTVEGLTSEERARKGAISLGKAKASQALSEAFAKLTATKTETASA